MPTAEQREQDRGEQRQARDRLNARIGEAVVRSLGEPEALHQVQVRRLWSDHYRVNVLVGRDAASAKVAHSYFLVTDGDGNIETSVPTITRCY
jgi:hypothetical protein